MIKDWTETEDEKIPTVDQFNPVEQELLKDATPTQIKQYGRLDQVTLEGMIVGHLIGKPNENVEQQNTYAAEKILEAGIKSDWFENEGLGAFFEDFSTFYKKNRSLQNIDECPLVCMDQGLTRNQSSMYTRMAYECLGALISRKIRVELLIERMLTHHLQKVQDQIYKKAVEERSNPKIGPKKSWENMREKCIKDLVDPRGAVIKEYEIIQNSAETISWLKDMKHHPEKYRGAMSGIQEIDTKTLGFQDGQLTVFCGTHGGFKTTMMLNIAYGLWENGFDVLYASLEMEALIVQTKILCRATSLSYSKLYKGEIGEPQDEPEIWAQAEPIIEKIKKGEGDKKALEAQLKTLLAKFDSYKAEEFYKKQSERKNKLVIVNVGQSEKMKMSQLERWLFEKTTMFKPKVVILDYLDLIQPEVLNPDRLDVGYGDICKMSRAMGKNMGFAVVTAAQMKRGAIERIRKHGLDSPEKAAFGTDDIAGSNMIGADADNVFMLWKKPGGTELMLFTAKARYTGMDNTAGAVLQVHFDTGKISGDGSVQSLEIQNQKKNMGDVLSIAPKLAGKFPNEEDPGSMFLGSDDMDSDSDFDEPIAPSNDDEETGDL